MYSIKIVIFWLAGRYHRVRVYCNAIYMLDPFKVNKKKEISRANVKLILLESHT